MVAPAVDWLPGRLFHQTFTGDPQPGSNNCSDCTGVRQWGWPGPRMGLTARPTAYAGPEGRTPDITLLSRTPCATRNLAYLLVALLKNLYLYPELFLISSVAFLVCQPQIVKSHGHGSVVCPAPLATSICTVNDFLSPESEPLAPEPPCKFPVTATSICAMVFFFLKRCQRKYKPVNSKVRSEHTRSRRGD